MAHADTLIYQNFRSIAESVKLALEYVERRLLPRASVCVGLETWWDNKTSTAVGAKLAKSGHRLYVANGKQTVRGTGAMVIVRADVEQADGERLVWARDDGKAIAVALTVAKRQFYVIATHYPHVDAQQAEFERAVRADFVAARVAHEALHPSWIGAGLLWAADRNTVVDMKADCQKPGSLHMQAVAEMKQTHTQWRLQDVWPWLRPGKPGYTLGEEGGRKRYDTWSGSTSLFQGDQGIVDIRVIPALQLSVPYTKKVKKDESPQKVSDHDAVEITLRSSTAESPPSEPRVHKGVLADRELRKWLEQSTAQLKGGEQELATSTQRFDAWAAAVIARCHAAHKRRSRAAAKERARIIAAVRDAAKQRAAETAAKTGAKEWKHRYDKLMGKLARHDRKVQRRRTEADQDEQREVEAGRGRKRKQAAPRDPPLLYMCTKDADGNILQEFKGQEEVAAHQRERWSSVLNMQGWNYEDVREEICAELRHVESDTKCRTSHATHYSRLQTSHRKSNSAPESRIPHRAATS